MHKRASPKNVIKVGLILLIFFVISFITNILGSLNPSITESFELKGVMAGMLPFSFFIAYGIMSVPSGILLERYREKKMLLLAFSLCGLGALLFVAFPTFRVFLGSLFTIGSSLAMLQVIINPLLRVTGGEEHYAFNSVLAQLAFGLASFVSPGLYTWVVTHVHISGSETNTLTAFLNRITPKDFSWVSVYAFFIGISLVMLVIVGKTRFPKVALKEDEASGSFQEYLMLLRSKTIRLFFFGIFAYVGTEQGISYWLSKFLSDYHGFDYQTIGANAVASYWGLMTLGGVLGLILLKFLDSKVVLRWFTFATLLCFLLGLFGNRQMALYLLPSTGFFMSVMYPVIISLALNSVDRHHGSFAGILMTGIMGGAVVQLVIGFLADSIGLKYAMLINTITLGYILSISFWAKPLIRNKVVKRYSS